MTRFLLILLLFTFFVWANNETIKIGVLAKRGSTVTFKKYNETAKYLSEHIPGFKFVIVPIPFNNIFNVVEHKSVDFILANSGFYVELEYRFGVQRITTLVNKHISGASLKTFGGVIFTHMDNVNKFNTLEDIKGHTFLAVNEHSFGGWQTAWREISEAGIDVKDDIKLSFSGTHDKTVYDVLAKKYEVGTVRTDTLERMTLEGKIDLSEVHIINRKYYDDFPFMISTELYPEWPFAKLKHTSDSLSKQVAIALMNMRADDSAAKASSISSWGTPLSYQPVHDCFKELEIPPYFHEIKFLDAVEKYWVWIFVVSFFAVSGVSMFLYQLRLTNNLRNTQDELVQTEKMASLGRLVAGISHEINTPIGIGVTAASHLKKEVQSFKKEFENESLTKSNFLEYIDHFSQSSGLILANLDRAAQLIQSFKQVSVDQSSDGIRTFDLKEYLNEIVLSLRPMLKAKNPMITINCPDAVKITSYPGAFYQVISNLIMNSMIHGFSERDDGKVTIDVEYYQHHLLIRYKDNGKGMSPTDIKKVFDPFFTTRRGFGGSGLGTHIVFNLVTQKLQGAITAQSEKGEGLTYIMHFKGIKDV